MNKKTALQAILALPLITSSHAALVLWDGSDSTLFGLDANWVPGIAPAADLATDTAQFSGTPTANQPAVTTGRTVGGLQFDSDGWIMGGGSTLKVGQNGILSSGNTTINTNLQIQNNTSRGGAAVPVISAAPGKTLTLGQISSDANSGAAVQFNSGGNTGTIQLNGTSDNGYIDGTVLAGKLIMNKGTVGGILNLGSSFSSLSISSGATVEYGINTTDRNEAGAQGRGQIYGAANVNGTLDLKGNGTFSDNWSLGNLNGATTGLITNTGTGAAQVRVLGGGTFNGNLNDGTSSTALRVDTSFATDVLTVTGTTNTYTGGTEILSGTLSLSDDRGLGEIPATPTTNIVMNGANARLKNNNADLTLNANRTIELGANGGGFMVGWGKTTTVKGTIIGTGKATIVTDGGVAIFENTANSYSGGTAINNVLRISGDGSLGAVPATVSTNIVMNHATAQLMNNDSNPIVNANRTIEIGAAGGSFKAGWSKTLTIAGAVTGTGSVMIAPDSGTVIFQGVNTYTGNTTLNASKLTLSDNASMLFKLGMNNENNRIAGSGATSILTLDGDFVIDFTTASIVDGNVWTLVDVATVGAAPFKSTFSVTGFTEAADVWSMTSGSNAWTFQESNGQLSLMVIPEPSVTLLGAIGALALLRRRR